MSKKRFLVDGRFLSSMATGVDRYAFETLNELDKICGEQDIRILVPESVKTTKPETFQAIENWKNIKVLYSSKEKGWTQVVFALKARLLNAIPINLCNEVSTFARKGIVCLHDVCYADCPEFFPKEETKWFLKIYERIAKHAAVIMTVSEFSKARIADVLGVSEGKIVVAGNGWQHFENVKADESIFDKVTQIKKNGYFFTLSSANKNKNVQWVVDAARNNPNEEFVIGGRKLDSIIDFSKYKNVHYVGAISDGEVKALMMYGKAFLFPSFYEGFGIPPLEALSTGAKIVVSGTASLPEIFDGCAHYIEPDNPMVHFESLLNEPVKAPQAVLNKYSWNGTARKLLEIINSF